MLFKAISSRILLLHTNFDAFDIITTGEGAKLKYGDEQVIITTFDATPLTADMFTQDDFIFG